MSIVFDSIRKCWFCVVFLIKLKWQLFALITLVSFYLSCRWTWEWLWALNDFFFVARTMHRPLRHLVVWKLFIYFGLIFHCIGRTMLDARINDQFGLLSNKFVLLTQIKMVSWCWSNYADAIVRLSLICARLFRFGCGVICLHRNLKIDDLYVYLILTRRQNGVFYRIKLIQFNSIHFPLIRVCLSA